MDNDTTQLPTQNIASAKTPPVLPNTENEDDHSTDPAPRTPMGDRVLDLVALLLLIALAAAVFVLAGPTAFTAVTGAGMGLFSYWRSHR
ncbi:hypothetical protein [Kitasatospora cineracea]|uniref:hypothetical protein n=1 Tax=Kitasatospora cineracea TaxID=88074 RepID=UPI0036CEDD3F